MTTAVCDVAIVGCGPTGAVLANLLGAQGCRVIVCEQAADVHPIPRATHIDEETQRNFQATGLLRELAPFMQPFGAMEVVDERGQVMFAEEIIDRSSRHGFARSCFFHQPSFERILRNGLARFENVELRLATTAQLAAADSEGVTLELHCLNTGERSLIRARWLVACDGGRSSIRESLGIKLESLAEKRSWVIVDALLKNAADASELPSCFRYYLDRERLGVYAHGFGLNRRWEFQLGVGEVPPSSEEVLTWLTRRVDLSKIDITRIATYCHHALVAESWQQGRVFLAGDAAHMMPPTAGQGMCSGIRDAVNLAWKLAAVSKGAAATELLATYEQERRPHVHEVVRGCLFLGRWLSGETTLQRWWRKQQLRLLARFRSLRSWVKRRGQSHPILKRGCLSATHRFAGQHLPQPSVDCTAITSSLDDQLGFEFSLLMRAGGVSGAQRAWCEAHAVRVHVCDADATEPLQELRAWLDAQQFDFVVVRPDKIVFAAGQRTQFATAQAALQRWLSPATSIVNTP